MKFTSWGQSPFLCDIIMFKSCYVQVARLRNAISDVLLRRNAFVGYFNNSSIVGSKQVNLAF